jgi:hypothetical protein
MYLLTHTRTIGRTTVNILSCHLRKQYGKDCGNDFMKKSKQAYEYEARLIADNIKAYLNFPLDMYRAKGVMDLAKQLLKLAESYEKMEG